MAEPPPRKSRRIDSSSTWDKHEDNSRNGDSVTSRQGDPKPTHDRRSNDTDRLSQRKEGQAKLGDRERERTEGRRERSRERDRGRDKGAKDERDRERLRRDDIKLDKRRSRSRSPVRGERRTGTDRRRTPPRSPGTTNNKDRRDAPRQRSPPRGPRNERDRPRHNVPPDPERSRAETKASSRKTNGVTVNGGAEKDKMDVDMDEGSEDELAMQMMKTMGFGKFKSTKNTKVPGNDKLYGVRKEKKTEYRQYMNRVGGFNRPLSPSRS